MEYLITQLIKITPSSVSQILFKQRRLLVFLLNLSIILCSLVISIIIRFEFSIPANYTQNTIKIFSIFILTKIVIYQVFHLNRGLWRYTSLVDIRRVLIGNLIASTILALIFIGYRKEICREFALSVIIIDFLFCAGSMSWIRVCVRMIREINDNTPDTPLIRTVVVGKFKDVNTFLHAIDGSKTSRKILGIFGPEKITVGTIMGIPIKGSALELAEFVVNNKIMEIILIPPYSRKRFLRLLMTRLKRMNYNCQLKIIPGADQITNGNVKISDIREVEIDDLLGRPPVKFDHTEILDFVKAKNVMVTGGGGSIGSELCQQLCKYTPNKLVIFEFSEYNLYETERKLKPLFPDIEIISMLGDIRFKTTLDNAIAHHSIDIIYHAAAYKHVPLLEDNISMGFHTNVIGTSNVADSAEELGVKRVVIISTDKAVRPTSIMGCTKRIAERVVLEREKKGTEFVVVRFGNVLGSRGSVVPLFKQQIKEGGPVTVTTKKMIRYFMSIPEAVELVLQAGTIGTDQDIMILEMGEQVNIYDMAKRLIELSGFMPHRDIQIKFTGIRPGEKEYEELLAKEEEVEHTQCKRICIARKQDKLKNNKVDINYVKNMLKQTNHQELRNLCFKYIPENMLGQHYLDSI